MEHGRDPCRWDSKLNVYTAEFSKNHMCMEHCQKLGTGRSPPLRTKEEWDLFVERAIGIDSVGYSAIYQRATWLAATDEVEEGVWRDYYYPHDKIHTN